MDALTWWRDYQPGDEDGKNGNLSGLFCPTPAVIEKTPEAVDRHEQYSDDVHNRHRHEDDIAAALWGRAPEKVGRLELIYAACNATPREPMSIGIDAVEWAIAVSNFSARAMLRKVREHVADSIIEGRTKDLLSVIPPKWITTKALIRRSQWTNPRERRELLDDLVAAGDVEREDYKPDGGGRSGTRYRRARKTN